MAFNPKAKKLELIEGKDVNKKSIDKLSKKYNTTTGKQAPCFVKLDHTFADGSVGPLFIFGKLNAFKAQIKDSLSKDPNKSLKAMAHVEFDEKGKSTLVLSPVKGKLQNKLTELTKAMKSAFTTAYADFKIGSEIDEKAADALEAAAEAEVDDDNDNEGSQEAETPKVETTAKPDATAKTNAVEAKLTDVVGRLEKLMAEMQAAHEAKDAEALSALDKKVQAAFAEVQSKK